MHGACIDPWVASEALAPILECRPSEVAKRLHVYVTGDRRFVPNGSALPPSGAGGIGGVTIEALEAAVAAAASMCLDDA